MKHYVLFSVEVPERTQHDKWQSWMQFHNDTLNRPKPAEGIRRLGENVWLLDRDSKADVLVSLGAAAAEQGLKYAVLFLKDDA